MMNRLLMTSLLCAMFALGTLPHRVLGQDVPSRQGFWFTLGLGYGSLGCEDCSSRDGGLSGGLTIGGTISPKLLIGVGTSGWSKSEGGTTLSVGTLDARLRFYPSTMGRFFLTGGLGVGTISADVGGYGSDAESGLGAILGLGYDFRIGSNSSLTAFWNGVGIKTDNSDANFSQIGIGITFH